MQSNLLLLSIYRDIDQIIHKLFWVSTITNKKVHLVSWQSLCEDKKESGLGLKPIEICNKAYMLKLSWRLLIKQNSFWAKIIHHKYLKGEEFSKATYRKK